MIHASVPLELVCTVEKPLEPDCHWSSRPSLFRLVGLVALFGFFAVGCTSGQPGQSDSSAAANGGLVSAAETEQKPVITIAVTDWTAAQANGVIAEKLIERRLGYPVTLVDVLDIEGLLEDLASGEISAILEVWTSTFEESEIELVNSGSVARLGDLGVTAKVGWYVPKYVVESDPALATWEGYLGDGVANDFSTPATGSSGRFLGTNPDYVTYDEEIISALGIPFMVEYSGSEEATRDELKAKVSRQEPVLAYWWSPTAEIMEFDLVNVALPPRDEVCLEAMAKGESMSCDYPEEKLVKLGWPGLAEAAPDLEQFLRNFTLSTEDQLAIAHAVETEGRSIDTVTTDWIESNEARWEAWFTADASGG